MVQKNIRNNNPFFKGAIVNFKEGDRILIRNPITHIPSVNDQVHLVTELDTLDYLAHKYYGDSKEWHVIADVNNIFDPFDFYTGLYVGTNLIIPYLEKVQVTFR